MPTAIDELFMAEALTGSVTRFADQSEDRSFLQIYDSAKKLLPSTDLVRWDQSKFSRGMAPVAGPSSPTKSKKKRGVTKKFGNVLAIKEHVDLDVRWLMMARGQGEPIANPEAELNNELLDLTNRIMRTKNFWAAKSVLTPGGSVDPGAFPNADLEQGADPLAYPVPAQIAMTAAWSDPTTKIRSGVTTAAGGINPTKRLYKQRYGRKVGVAIASDTVEGYITGNNEITNFIKEASPAARALETSFAEGGAVPRFAAIDWLFVRDDYAASDAADASDTLTDVITDPDLVALLPERARWSEAFGVAEGRQFVPTGMVSSLATGNPLSMLQEFRGFAAWVEMPNPTTLRLCASWCGLLLHLEENAAQVLNTTP
jgi:hypothetical protein